MEAEQQITDAEEVKVEEEEAERSEVENFEVGEDAEFWQQLKVSDEAEVHVGMAVSFQVSSAEPEVAMSLQPAVDMKEKKVVEDGEKYFVVDGCSGSWKFDVKSSDEEKMNNDVLKLQKEDSVGVLLRKNESRRVSKKVDE